MVLWLNCLEGPKSAQSDIDIYTIRRARASTELSIYLDKQIIFTYEYLR